MGTPAEAREAHRAMRRAELDGIIRQLNELWGTGTRDEIAEQVGYDNAASLIYRLRKNGHDDIAAKLRGGGWPGQAARNFAELIEDIEWIIHDRGPKETMLAVGYNKPASLVRRLHRWGRNDLAEQFAPLAYAERRQWRRKSAKTGRSMSAEVTVLSA